MPRLMPYHTKVVKQRNLMQVTFTQDQFDLIQKLVTNHYSQISFSNQIQEIDEAYSTLLALRLPLAERDWKRYCELHPDENFRVYSTKKEFFQDQYNITL